MSNYGIVIQARASSTRLPKKVLMDVEGQPMLFRQADRIKHFIPWLPLIIATSTEPSDDPIEEMCIKNGLTCFRGSLDDVVLRFLECSNKFNLDHIIRVGGDDPLIDPECCIALVDSHKKEEHDLIYASSNEGWPYGSAAELISKTALKVINLEAKDQVYKEHTIPYFFDNPEKFSIKKLQSPASVLRPNYYFTVDFPEDLELIRKIFKTLKNEGDYFTFRRVIKLIDENQEFLNINQHLHSGFDR